METTKLVLSVEEARQALGGLSRSSMYKAVREGVIDSCKIGRRILIPIRSLERFLQGQTGEKVDQDKLKGP